MPRASFPISHFHHLLADVPKPAQNSTVSLQPPCQELGFGFATLNFLAKSPLLPGPAPRCLQQCPLGASGRVEPGAAAAAQQSHLRPRQREAPALSSARLRCPPAAAWEPPADATENICTMQGSSAGECVEGAAGLQNVRGEKAAVSRGCGRQSSEFLLSMWGDRGAKD